MLRSAALLAIAIATVAAVACKGGEASDSKGEKTAAASGSASGEEDQGLPPGKEVVPVTTPLTTTVVAKAPDFKKLYSSADDVVSWSTDDRAPFSLFYVSSAAPGNGLALICSISVNNPRYVLVSHLAGAATEFANETNVQLRSGYLVDDVGGKAVRLGDDGKTTEIPYPGVFAAPFTTARDIVLSIAASPSRLVLTPAQGAPTEVLLAGPATFVGLSSDEKKAYVLVGATPRNLFEVDFAAGTPRQIAAVPADAAVELLGDKAYLVTTEDGKAMIRGLEAGADIADVLPDAPTRLRTDWSLDGRYHLFQSQGEAMVSVVFDAVKLELVTIAGHVLQGLLRSSQIVLRETGAVKARDLATGTERALTAGLAELDSPNHPARVFLSPDGVTSLIGGVDPATRDFVYQLASPTRAPTPLDLKLAKGKIIDSVIFGPKGKWLLVAVKSGEAHTEPDDPNSVHSVALEDSCGGMGSTVEAYLVRADGSEATLLFQTTSQAGISLGGRYRFDASESQLLRLDAGSLETYVLPQ